jgi:hypothetical protein
MEKFLALQALLQPHFLPLVGSTELSFLAYLMVKSAVV